jgi:hypothetical protein
MPGHCPGLAEGSDSPDAVVGAWKRAETTPGSDSRSTRWTDLLRLPAGARLAIYRAARKRAEARLRAAHRDEYEALVQDELANPHYGSRP